MNNRANFTLAAALNCPLVPPIGSIICGRRLRPAQLGYETTKLNIARKWKALPTNTNPCQMAWW
jgi:hypothetical protein